MKIDHCRDCHKAIVWARTQHGKPVPLDPKALVFSVRDEKGQLVAVSVTGHVTFNGDQFMVSHFATCPFASKWSGQSREPAPAAPADRHFSEPHDVE